jgi:hypothetical protein
MPSALLTADSGKLSIEAIKPDTLRVSYRDGTVDRSTMIIRAPTKSQAVVLSIRAGGARLRRYAWASPLSSARLRGWEEGAEGGALR